MSVTILETLQNAECNLKYISKIGLMILPLAQGQLHNALALLEKGYGIYEEVEPLLEKYGDVENVPEHEPSTL